MITKESLCKLEKYIIETEINCHEWFIFNLLNFNYYISDKPLTQTDIQTIEKEDVETLRELGFVSKLNEDALFEQKTKDWERFIEENYNPEFSKIVIRILPTLQCNFRCSYCYQDSFYEEITRKNSDFMSIEVLQALLKYIEENVKFDKQQSLRLELAGGEVFLRNRKAFSFVKHLIAGTNHPEIELVFITNGYHLDSFIPILKGKKEITYNITIDGTVKIHDKRRFLANGEGSFDRIISNIDKIITETTHKVRIRCNIDDHNITDFSNLLDFLENKEWFKSNRFDLIIRATTEYLENAKGDMPLGENIISTNNMVKLLNILIEHKMNKVIVDGTIMLPVLKILFWDKFFEITNKKENIEDKTIDIICDANQGHFGFVDYNGSVRRCGFELAEECGSIFPEIKLDEEKIKNWNSLEFILEKFNSKPCRNCRFFFLCGMRQCSFSQYEYYVEERGSCENIERNIELFLNNYAKFL